MKGQVLKAEKLINLLTCQILTGYQVDTPTRAFEMCL